jgi:predicted transcriptional regulator
LKAGPSGPALALCLHDLRRLPDELINSIKKFGGGRLAKDMTSLLSIPPHILQLVESKFLAPKSKSLRKLSLLADKEGKTRIFAILDY